MRNLAILAMVGYAAAGVTAPAQAKEDAGLMTPPCVNVVFTGVACSYPWTVLDVSASAEKRRANYLALNPITIGRTFSGRIVMGPPGCTSFEDQPASVELLQSHTYGPPTYLVHTKLEFDIGGGPFSIEPELFIRQQDARCVKGGPK